MGMRQRLGVAACLLADPELLILDEPMNGLDPAGMHEMRAMIESLVEEGRTVMLSSHLLDEVERTCDAVAIVDHGRVIRQGTIEDLVRGAGARVVRLECADPAAASGSSSSRSRRASLSASGVTVTLPAEPRVEVEELTRRLVEGGVGVSGIQQVRASLEDWFLTVTSRLEKGEQHHRSLSQDRRCHRPAAPTAAGRRRTRPYRSWLPTWGLIATKTSSCAAAWL